MNGRSAPAGDIVVPNSMVASAVRLTGLSHSAGRSARRGQGWHQDAWYFYDTIGEYRFAVNWVGNMLSRARLYAAKRVGDDWVPEPPDSVASQAVTDLCDGAGGQTQLLQQCGVNFTVTGECYLLGYTVDGHDVWVVASSTEASYTGKRWKLHDERLPEEIAAVRLWRPHPNDRRYSDSPTRAVLPVLSEIDSLTKHVSAQVDSRLAGAGVYWVPAEMTFGNSDGDPSASTFVDLLTEAMQTAKKNRADASALVPIVVTAPGEYLDKVKYDTFWSPLDEHAVELRTEAIRRLSLGMDMPPEVLTGTADMNHWNVWQSDEAAIKVHTTPPLELITSSLTVGYLQPHMETEGFADSRAYAVLADTSQMRARPNRSREAIELHNIGKINAAALLREVGFDSSDAMGEPEFRQWLLAKVAGGSATPEQVDAALRELGVDLRIEPAPGIVDVERVEEETREARPDPTLERHPDRSPPELPAGSALLAASEILVLRALERAGNKIKNRVRGKFDVAAVELYLHAPPHPSNIDRLLEDAWSMVPRVAAAQGVQPEELARVLDSYARLLLVERREHDPELLAANLLSLAKEPVA